MLEADELDNNPVFRSLQGQFMSYFSWAQDKRGLVCVPHSRSVRGLELNRDFIEKHMFRPSPLFKDHYITRDARNPSSISLEGASVITGEGFPEERTAKILSEELGYNKRSETFRILIIDRPLVGKVKAQDEDIGSLFDSQILLTHSESRSFLSNFPGGSQVLATLNAEIQLFCSNYMILPEFLDDAVEKLRTIWTTASKGFFACLGEKAAGDAKFLKGQIQLAVESYLLGSVNGKLFPEISEHCNSEDVRLGKKCSQLRELTPAQLGVPSSIQCDLTVACEKLASLDNCLCTLEKMVCLKEVMDCITKSAKSTDKPNGKPNSSSDDALLTSDQYIPLLVSVIVTQKSKHIVSHIYYLDKFQFYPRPSDSQSFSLVTFKAAYSYVESLNPQLLLPPKTENHERKRSSHESVTDSPSPRVSSSASPTSPLSPKTRMERDLDRITQMMQTPTKEFKEGSRLNQSQHAKTNSTASADLSQEMRKARTSGSSLGEFLSALRDDKRLIVYGKQN